MKINEIFRSISGESINAGYLAIFIRAFSCNLRCSYCDSLYSVEGNGYTEMSVDEILDFISQWTTKRVVFTGGEPLLQHDAKDLIFRLANEGYMVEVETNGAVALDSFLKSDSIIYTMDWKCPSSGMNKNMIAHNLELLRENDVIKFVVSSEEDLNEAATIIPKTCAIPFISPVFGKIEPKDIVYYMKYHNMDTARFQLQLHKYVWPIDMRGV